MFDAEAFALMRTEALTMDPQQRLLLHAVHDALALNPGAVFGRNVGAYVGIAGELPRSLWSHARVVQGCCSAAAAVGRP